MLYKKLGNTDVDVSIVCLGTMTFGERNSESDAYDQLDYFVEKGGNFIDTAEACVHCGNLTFIGLDRPNKLITKVYLLQIPSATSC